MREAVSLFKDLPATFPERDQYKKQSIICSIVFHVALITAVVVIPLLFPQRVAQSELLHMLVAPFGPPPAPPPPPAPLEVAAMKSAPAAPKILKPSPDAVIMPSVIPKEIARIIDEPVAPVSGGVIGGVPGGVPGGAVGGVLASILARNARELELAPPPPPPPPPPLPPGPAPTAPVRVGGNVREPTIIKLVQPVYPPLASKARVSGMVVLEATLTAEGTVEEIRVISGHPLLVQAAIDAVKQWRYEPTYLNGIPVPVILTAKVNFYGRTEP